MEIHHQESIEKFLEIYKKDPSVLAILLGGSIAHGFARPGSDIDLLLIVSQEEFQKRKASNELAFCLRDICTYENGYIDCKIADLDFLSKVSEYGSDAAKYAFKDNKILFSRYENLNNLLSKISAFPKEKINERRKRFASQLLAWKWFYSEGVKKKNNYLIFLALQKIVLFSSRIILNENELLYPFHKWVLEEVKLAALKPKGIIKRIEELFEIHSIEKVNEFCKEILDFINFNEKTVDWPNYFLNDSEQNWIEHEPPIDDL
jgi:predicted nucleotidyltransferase